MPRRLLLRLLAIAAVAIAYTITAKLGLRLAFLNPSATPVWPPTGLALAAFLRWGTELWPGVFVGAFLANVTTAGTLATSVGIATGNTLEAWVGAAAVRRFAGDGDPFEHPHDVFRFVLLAGIATIVSATIGVSSLGVGGFVPRAEAGSVWLTWWMGDLAGALTVAPPLVLWGRRRPNWSSGMWVEALALLSTTGLVGAATFGYLTDLGLRHVPLEFLCIPVMLWAALRFGASEAATVTLLFSTLAIGGTLRGLGPFVRPSTNESLLLLQAYMATLSVVGLAVSAAVEERRRAAESVRRLNEGLLAAEQATRRMVEEESRRKDEFLAMLAHELRTPLNAIVGWTHLLREGRLESDTHDRALETLERNARIQARLISNLLDVSRFQSGRLEIDRQRVEFARVVERAVETVQPTLAERGVSIQLELDDALPAFAGDPDRLQQVVWNLLSNAATFAAEGGIVRVTLCRDGDEAELRVIDDGPGIDPGFLPQVFDPFRQRDASPTRGHGGLGLGLAIALHLVERHGGTIAAANRTDRSGAVFTVRLPLVGAPEPPTPERDSGGAPVGERAPLAGMSVLLVEDADDSREFVTALLSVAGARVTDCRSASEAWDALAAVPPAGHGYDVLVTDIAMPVEDGSAFLGRVRASGPPVARDIPAVALTAYAAASDVAKAMRDGFQAHVAKPVDAAELLRIVASLGRRAS